MGTNSEIVATFRWRDFWRVESLAAVIFLGGVVALAGCMAGNIQENDLEAEHPREPLTSTCGDPEEIRCLLPWPSNSFVRVDETTETGLRLAIEESALPVASELGPLLRADGFSRISPILFGFGASGISDGEPPSREVLEGSIWLIEAPTGRMVPTQVRVEEVESEILVILWPRQPMEPGTDHIVAVADVVPTTRRSQVALARVEPETVEEEELRRYHEPTREIVTRAGLEPERLSRVWDFTTRSAEDVTGRLRSMVEAARLAGEQAEVAIDRVTIHEDSRAMTLVGRLLAMPQFAPSEQAWTLDDEAMPVEVGTEDVIFRVVLPAGEGDYPVSMYGHGLIGDYNDSAFDEEIAEMGLAKVGMNLHGWNSRDTASTVMGLKVSFSGFEVAVARLAQGIADAAAIQSALSASLSDALAAPTLLGDANPAAGRRPNMETTIWTGGSLGGMVGALYSVVHGGIDAAVLNVPGSGWSQIIPESVIFELIAEQTFRHLGSAIDRLHVLTISQGIWDEVDPAVWIDALPKAAPVALLQESIGDEVLPNQGTELLAAAFGATQVGAVLSPVPGLSHSDGPIENQSGLTQFRVSEAGLLAVHGFAARDTAASEAAREQIGLFVESVLEGSARIEVPEGCVDGSCDFSD